MGRSITNRNPGIGCIVRALAAACVLNPFLRTMTMSAFAAADSTTASGGGGARARQARLAPDGGVELTARDGAGAEGHADAAGAELVRAATPPSPP